MTAPRAAVAVLLGLLLSGPVLLPVAALFRSPDGWAALLDVPRIARLAANTLALAAGACAVAVPAGVLVAIAFERIAFPGRRFARGLLVAALFVPLPVTAVAWQIVLGAWLPPLRLAPGEVAWRPWAEGLLPAAWVHGAAGFPWVAWLVGAALRTADRGLEETALLDGGPGAVLRRAVLPRAGLAAVAAAGWVAVAVLTEITVTDTMMVRTFAEEVYTQYVGASDDGLSAAVAVTVPAWLLSGGLAVVALRSVRTLGEPPPDADAPRDVPVSRRTRRIAGMAVWVAVSGFVLLPVVALAWKAGGGGTRTGWGIAFFVGELAKVARTDGATLAGSLLTAAATGALAAVSAWVACGFARESRAFAGFLFGLAVLLWVTPAPVAGLGLKAAIELLLRVEDAVGTTLLRSLLYDGPSPVPVVWAGVVRLFPVAVAVVWPAVWAVPRDLLDAAKLDGLGRFGTWRTVVRPLTGGAAVRAGAAVAALALAEVGAGRLVAPPGLRVYILSLFDQMHYGAESTVAALAQLQLAGTAGAAGLVLWAFQPGDRR